MNTPNTDKRCSAKTCNHACTRNGKTARSKTVVPILNSAIIAILPKCPLCALAYSTAITMCSGKVYSHEPDWTSYISIILAIVTFVIVLVNYKGKRTVLALIAIGAATVIVGYSELVTGNVLLYYAGCAMLVLGVWLNGSLLYFWRKWFGDTTVWADIKRIVNVGE